MKEAPLSEHLEELRARLIKALLAWGLGMAVAYNYRTPLLELLKRPLEQAELTHGLSVDLIVLTITEPFTTALQIAAFGGLVLALPVVAYQVWAFVAPGLYPSERKLAVPFLVGAGFSFAVGVAFAYQVLLPFAVPFLVGFLGDVVTPQISIGGYISQIVMYLALMGILFEIPVLSYLLAKLGLVTGKFLAQNRKYALVIIVALAALITPTADPFNLALLSVPLLLLYELGIWIARLAEPKGEALPTGDL